MDNRRQATVNVFRIAELCHEANRAICESTGDHTQSAWEHAAQWQKDSALQGVLLVLDTPDITPETLHVAWLDAKRADGWIYGPTKDATTKTHPCMVPYDQLPTEQKTKDYVFRALVMTLSRPA